LAVGLYLVAAALSTADEDLRLQHTTSIAQLGVPVHPMSAHRELASGRSRLHAEQFGAKV
jgi:hypothetical protein